jgi:hypothetical protein
MFSRRDHDGKRELANDLFLQSFSLSVFHLIIIIFLVALKTSLLQSFLGGVVNFDTTSATANDGGRINFFVCILLQ